jgi:hypothetical protein
MFRQIKMTTSSMGTYQDRHNLIVKWTIMQKGKYGMQVWWMMRLLIDFLSSQSVYFLAKISLHWIRGMH